MQNSDLASWGKSLLEEIVLQAALAVPESGAAQAEYAFDMPFRITADPAGRLLVRCTRVGSEDLVACIDIPNGENV